MSYVEAANVRIREIRNQPAQMMDEQTGGEEDTVGGQGILS